MKLEQIEIENFRCFERLTVPLDREVNAFIGINASGKTAILDAIAIALFGVIGSNLDDPLDKRRQKTALRTTDIRIGAGAAGGRLGQIQEVRVRASATEFPDFKHPGSPPTRIEWVETIEFQPPEDFGYSTEWFFPAERIAADFKQTMQLSLLEDASCDTRTHFPVFAYYRTHRRFSEMPSLGDIFNLKLGRESAYADALDAGADYGAMCRWFYMRENQELRERDRNRDKPDLELPDLKAIRGVLSIMLDNVTRAFFDDNPPRLKVDLREPGKLPKELEVEQLSDGYRNLLALALDFARRLALANPGWENPREAPGILLIDEIELHLHPKWQQTVIPRLRAAFPNTQLIVATHSPQVLTTLQAKQIHILRDQQVYAPSIETYGAESMRTARLVMDTQSRPPNNPNSQRIVDLFALINQGELDDAASLVGELEAVLGADDPTLVEARATIENRKWEQEIGL